VFVEHALLLIGACIAAAVSGSAGFGGALLLLPALTMVVGAKEAVPLLTVAQLIGNLSRATLGFGQIRWRPVALFLLGALPASILGALSFVRLDRATVTRSIGLMILAIALLRLSGRLRFQHTNGVWIAGSAITGFLSGVAGSAGPVGAALGGSMILGTWAAMRLIERLPRAAFERYVSTLRILISIYMLVHG